MVGSVLFSFFFSYSLYSTVVLVDCCLRTLLCIFNTNKSSYIMTPTMTSTFNNEPDNDTGNNTDNDPDNDINTEKNTDNDTLHGTKGGEELAQWKQARGWPPWRRAGFSPEHNRFS